VERDVEIPLVSLAARIGIDLNQTAGVHTSASGLDARVRIGIAF